MSIQNSKDTPSHYFSKSKAIFMEISSMNTKHIENAVKKLTYTDSDGDSVMYDKRLENMKKELDKRYKQ
ncbi:MAG: hypothetical protein HN802_05075, partial [Candidatus Jacksonbacteria bacterium]|nr:hypothetical protein [Candidatus Jacksonbacteria bacterium]